MFGGTTLIRSRPEQDFETPWTLPPAAPADEPPSPLARDEEAAMLLAEADLVRTSGS